MLQNQLATVNNFLEWVYTLTQLDDSPKYELVSDCTEDDDRRRVHINLFTQLHRYAITAVDVNKKAKIPSYLGCIAYNRAPYAGENHIRSRDLPDGNLTLDTWQSIKDAILWNELVYLA